MTIFGGLEHNLNGQWTIVEYYDGNTKTRQFRMLNSIIVDIDLCMKSCSAFHNPNIFCFDFFLYTRAWNELYTEDDLKFCEFFKNLFLDHIDYCNYWF